jgi:uncharacterized protein (TIGR00730 family)
MARFRKVPLNMTARSLSSICVYCGSNPGARAEYRDAARQLGEFLAGRGIRLIYGGGSVGLMGAVAEAAMQAGGEVIGVIPSALDRREISNRRITELRVVASMHERKALMNELSDGFIALPGGYGTFEELCEMLTWSQLGIHRKPIGLFNIAGYYDTFLAMLDHAVAERFLHPDHRALLLSGDQPAALLSRMESFETPITQKWMDTDEV